MTRFARPLFCLGILALSTVLWTCHGETPVTPPGPPTALTFTAAPTNVTAGEPIATVKVTALDASNHTATSFAGSVTVSITPGTGTTGATLSGTATVTAVDGVATFTTLNIDRSGPGYTLRATSGSLTTATSGGFSVAAGPVSQLAFKTQPTSVNAGTTIAPAVTVSAQDALGNTVPTFAGTVTVTITPGTGTSGATLSGTTATAAAAGVATFNDLKIDKVGTAVSGTGYTLSAVASSLPAATSDPFDIRSGSAALLQFTTQPTATAAGAAFAPLVEVSALDSAGNVVASFTGNVTLAIGTNGGSPTPGTLLGPKTVAAVNGVATFPGVSIDKIGTGYTLSATATGLAAATSAGFTVIAAPAATLSFTTQPVTATNAAALAPAVRVTARDAFGNVARGFASNVTVAIAQNPAGGTLSGTTTLAAIQGVTTFADLSIDKVGTGYTLAAAAAGVVPDTSTAFDIVASTADKLVCTVEPTRTTAGGVITPAIQISAFDASNQLVTSFTGNVTVAITGGTGSLGATLSGTATVPAAGGIATFGDLSIDKSGVGYTLTAVAGGGLQSAVCGPFDVTSGSAKQLAFTVQPSNVAAATAITPQVEVTARDSLGNVATSFTGLVTVTIVGNPSGGVLSGTASKAAVAGVASFPNLSIDKSGLAYVLGAAAGGLTPATSGSFDVSAGAPSQLAFTAQPTTTTAGANLNPAVQLTAKDGSGNVVTTFNGDVTLSITTGTGTAGATLSGTRTVTASAGIANFADLNIDEAGTGYTLSAIAVGFAGVTSGTFAINPGPAARLTFTTEPVSAIAGATLSTVQVTAQDAHGNTVPSYGANITVSIGTNPGGGTMSGTATVPPVQGVAAFSTLSIDRSGVGYTLAASSGSLTGATSTPFTVTASAATTLAFTVQPSNAAAGTAITPIIVVSARDPSGNTVTSFNGDVTIDIATNPAGGTLLGTKTIKAVQGVASFSNLSMDKAAIGYALSASTPGLGSVTSAFFNIVPGAAAVLAFTVQPATATTNANISPAVKVTARDAFGNTAIAFAGNVTIAIGANPGSSTLSGTRTFAAVNGVATFSGLGLNNVGTGYTLTASSPGLSTATSAAFDIVASTAVRLFFSVQPTSAPAGAPIPGSTGPVIQVTARDVSGQTVASYTGAVTLTISTNPGGGTLGGSKTVAAVAGVASFPNLSIDKTGTGYKLTASASGLTDAISAAISINGGTATKLVFTLPPSTSTAHATITPRVEVTALDGLGNIADGFTGTVTVAIGTNPGAGTLSGTLSTAAIRGIASFSTLSIDQAAKGYTLTASATNVTGATSPPFDVAATLATQLVFTVQPATTTAGASINPIVKVSARDASGLVATGFTGNVTLTITANTGTAGSTLSGTTTAPLISGVAAFPNLSINHSGSGFRLSAIAPGAAGTTSSPFTINFGPAARVAFSVQPATANAATIIGGIGGPPIQATVEDALGNPVKSFGGTVSITIAANPGGGSLSGSTSVPTLNGVASFNNLMIDKAGTGYRLGVTATALPTDTSDAFSITAGPATTLLFTVQPSNAAAGAAIAPAIRVTALDAQGNVATGFTGNVTLAIDNNPGGGSLTGSTTVAAVSGVATFSGLSISPAGIGYTLKATATGVTKATSVTFNIN